jgi:precorrin-6B methylase 1
MTGSVVIAGLGPGNEDMVTPEVRAALAQATDIVGYIPYVARVAPRDGLTLHASDNRVEIDRSRHALEMAAAGKRVVVVSSGDPGVFAMASAVFEALEAGPEAWRGLDIQVLPGITAMLAAAAAIEKTMQAVKPETSIEMKPVFGVPPLSPENGGPAEVLSRRLTGDNGTHVVSYGTEGGQFQTRGYSVVVCGPGDIAQAHQPDEFLTLEQFAAGQSFMERLIDDLTQ